MHNEISAKHEQRNMDKKTAEEKEMSAREAHNSTKERMYIYIYGMTLD